jgi:hypothetical protein
MDVRAAQEEIHVWYAPRHDKEHNDPRADEGENESEQRKTGEQSRFRG